MYCYNLNLAMFWLLILCSRESTACRVEFKPSAPSQEIPWIRCKMRELSELEP